MRRSLFAVALLGTTALTPGRAAAMPQVIPFISGFIAATTPIYLGGASLAGFGAGVAFGGSAIGGLIARAVIGLGLSAIAQALQPRPQAPEPSARMANFAQPKSYAEWVYGRTRKGGPLGFTGFQSKRRYYAPVLAAHSVEGVVDHWLDEIVVTVDAGETDYDVSNITAGGSIPGYGRIDFYDGGSGQAADPGLVNHFTEITSAHDFEGLAYAVIWAKKPSAEKFSKVYPRGRQWAYAPVFDGNDQIWDPRDSSYKYTNNAALCLAHWLTEVLGREVDWDEVGDEADACDVSVTNKESETQPRWTINGTVADDQDFESQRAQMAAACDAFLYERTDGKVGFRVGRWIAPTVTLTAADFYSLEIVEGDVGSQAPTEVAATYIEPENAWRETPSGTWVEEASSRVIRDEPQLYMVHSHNQASRINKRIAKTRRAQYRLSGTLGPVAYELIGQRFVRVQHAEMAIDEVFEVGELAREGMVQFTLTANSVEESDFAFTAASEEPARPSYNSVTSNDDIDDVTGLAGTAVDGSGIDWEWDEQDESYTQQLRIRENGASDWQVISIAPGESTFRTTGLLDGTAYEAQVRNRTLSQRAGDWKPDTPVQVTAVGNSTAPAALDSFTATENAGDVDLDFVAPNDANYFAARIYRNTGSTDFGTATLIRTEYGIPSNSDSYTDAAPGVGTHYYWGEPINSSGVAGTKSGPETVVIS